jgi:hypothetical protein
MDKAARPPARPVRPPKGLRTPGMTTLPAVGPPPETHPPSGTHAPPTAPVHSPLGTRPGARLPYSPTGYRRSVGPTVGPIVGPLRRATPSLLTVVFIHFQESSSTDHKMHPLSRKLITCSEISSSIEKFHPLFKKCTYCVASSSFAYQIHPLCHFLSEGILKIIHGKPRNLQ